MSEDLFSSNNYWQYNKNYGGAIEIEKFLDVMNQFMTSKNY